MKTPNGPVVKPGFLAAAILAATLAGAPATALTPIAVGEEAVTAVLAGRANLALASGGGVAFSSSDLGTAYAWDRLNDGVRDGSGNSWIPATTGGAEFAAVKFAAASTVGTVAWSGQAGYNGRSAGTWVLQYTTAAAPSAGSTWTEIGTYLYAEPSCNTPMPRTCFSFTPVAQVTGLRLLITSVSCGQQAAVQELEVYGPLSLTPSAVGDAPVAAAIAGRPNLALASAGGTAFSSSDLGADYSAPAVNNGITDQSGFSWIASTAAGGDSVGVAFAVPANIDSVVWHGQTGYDGRSGADYSLEYTLEASPGLNSRWVALGHYTYVETGCASPMPRSFFSFPVVTNATGVRLVVGGLTCGVQPAIQELEAYGPLVNPPSITASPTGGTYAEGSMVTLTVQAEGGTAFQWKKDGVDIAGAKGSSYTLLNLTPGDAGSYTVKVVNPAGDVTSDPAVLVVTPAPVFATYAEAVITDSPIHYYPLDEVSGTTATDLGTMATSGGTYAGGCTLGQTSASARLGKAVRFDGKPGTWVDLGLFHAGDAVSVEAWINLDLTAGANYNAIVARWDGSYELDFATGDLPGLVVRNQNNDFGSASFPSAQTRGLWHHIVGVYANGQITVWLDGVPSSTGLLTGPLRDGGPAPDRVLIGATRDGTVSSFNWKGLIDEVAVYDYGLSAAQIRNHYRAGAPAEPLSLNIQRAVLLSWPVFPAGYTVLGAPKVEGPYTPLTQTPIVEDSLNKMTVITTPTQQYFRLQAP